MARRTPAPTWLVVLAPVLPLVWVVQRYWVDVPWGDQWELPTDIRQIHDEGVDVSDLWRQHNEHRIVFPRLAMLALAWPTRWDVRAEMTLSLCLALASLGLLCLLLRRTFVDRLPAWAVIGIATVTAAVVFSPMQYENWLWGFQISWYLNVLGVVSAAAVLVLWPTRRRAVEPVLAAAGCVIVAQYSLANGTAAWLCLVPLVLLRTRTRGLIVLWGALALVSTGTYLAGYTKPAHHPPLSEIFRHPVEGVRYTCLFLGRTVFDDRDVGVAFGAFLLACFVGLCVTIGLRRRDLWAPSAPWICIAAYVLCSASTAAAGRAGFGINQAAASRYTTIALLFLLATLVLATIILRPADWAASHARPALLIVAWLGVLGMFAADYPDQTRRMEDLQVTREQARLCLLTVTSPEGECLTRLYPRPGQVYPRIQYLRDLGWLPQPLRDLPGTAPG